MKHKISISVSEETILRLREKLKSSNLFRSKSHLIEYAINSFLEDTK